jgi:hypothetical protein
MNCVTENIVISEKKIYRISYYPCPCRIYRVPMA